MIPGNVRQRRGPLRILLVLTVAALLSGTAYGPARIADALGLHRMPPPPPESVGFLPDPRPIEIISPTARVIGLSKVVPNQALRLADGSMSPPDMLYLRAKAIELDKLSITQLRPGQSKFSLNNKGSGDQAALVGSPSPDSVVEIWVRPVSLKLCVTAQTLKTIIVNYAGVFGGRLDQVLQLLADAFTPFANGPLGPVGPCLPIQSLLPLIGVLIDYGVPLPAVLPVAGLDLNVYVLKVATSGPQTPSIVLPLGQLEVAPA
ncbi:hypothetical protein FOS14_10885 [Skermania sp. ID1734]|uniref:hypothetical protein n=1 Tax=Skermania sp. ID1734 TaxID=2597516 RepID=UPI00117CB362|nr:hypothetical protein [Skermania sp. ID1734]TSD99755.1 hypothetical protein FOS14_10885 [Skermania sp. ID1734]